MDPVRQETTNGEEPRLVYTVAEAGALLGISRAFAYELVARGELPVIRLGRRRLVPRLALLALAEGRDGIHNRKQGDLASIPARARAVQAGGAEALDESGAVP